MAKGRGTEGPGKWLPRVRTENEIAEIPAHAFLGAPNLEWLDLNKNKLDALGLHPDAFKVRGSPSSCCPGGWRGKRPWASSARPPPPPYLEWELCRNPAPQALMIWGNAAHSYERGEQHRSLGPTRKQHSWEKLRGVPETPRQAWSKREPGSHNATK